MSTFDKCFERTHGSEGGYQASPNDRGNWTSGKIGEGELKGTKFGISAMTYPHLDIKNLTVQQAKDIYYKEWWLELRMDEWREGLGFQLFDSAINHGMYNTTKMLQRAVNTKPDGIIGVKTKAAIKSLDINDVLFLFLAERLTFMTNAYTWNKFGKGQARRIASNLRYAAQDN